MTQLKPQRQFNSVVSTEYFVAVMMFDFDSTSTLWSWLETAIVGSHDSWVVVSRGSRVTRVTGQLTDGSRGSRVKKCDPLSSLVSRATNGIGNAVCSELVYRPSQKLGFHVCWPRAAPSWVALSIRFIGLDQVHLGSNSKLLRFAAVWICRTASP